MEAKDLNKIELFIRNSLSEEQLAVANYIKRQGKLDKLIEDADEIEKAKLSKFKDTLQDIIDEEKVHIGQFTEMLNLFNFSREKEFEGELEAQQESFKTVAKKLKTCMEVK